MPRPTIASLTALLNERNTECEALRLKLSIAERNVTTPEPARPVPRTQAQILARILPEHFVKARELAMRTGHSVKVLV